MPGSTRSYEMATRLALKGHEVHILTSKRDSKKFSKKWEVEEKDGFTVHWLSAPYSNHMSFYNRVKSFFYYAFYASNRGIFLDGDLVFAKHQSTAELGEMVIAQVEDEATVKYYYTDDDGVRLEPANEKYTAIRVHHDQTFSIAGKVIGVMRKLKT